MNPVTGPAHKKSLSHLFLISKNQALQPNQTRIVMHNKSNEGKACDAVVRLIEKRTGMSRTHIRFPEIDGNGPPVDLCLKLGAREYAIEHTLIEPFENQIKTEVIIKEIVDHFKENIPLPFPSSAYYELQYSIPISLPDGASKRTRALNGLAEWVCMNEKVLREKKRELPILPFGPYFADQSVRGKPDGFNCTFDLLRCPNAACIHEKAGSLWLRPVYPEDMMPLTRKRLMRAFSRKCKKLQDCKADGARTVLVLESRDAVLTHFQFRGELLPAVLAKHSNVPDEIFLVQTSSDPWQVTPLKYGGGYWPDTGMPELGQSYFDPDNSDIPKWLDTIPQHIRAECQLDRMDTPYLQGWVPGTFEKDELSDLAQRQGQRQRHRLKTRARST